MPIYEYECNQCGEILEVIQSFSDKPLKKCSKCTGHLQKLISHSSFHLKGTGWYVTDYSNKSGTNSTPSSVKNTSKTEKKESSTPTSSAVESKKD